MFSITGEHDHGPFAGGGVQLAWGSRADGSLAHISEVERGKKCDCVCPACERALIARKGTRLAHNFAHQGGHACAGVRETNAHAWAKRILGERKELWLPAGCAVAGKSRRQTFAAGPFKFDRARLEKREGSIIPDVVLSAKGRELIVEILVTHACDDAKISKIRDQGKSALEIDLSRLRHAESEMIVAEALIGGTHRAAPRAWLYNARVERDSERLALEDARKAEDLEKRRRVAREREIRWLIAAAGKVKPKATDATLADVTTVTAYGLSGRTGVRVEGARGFSVPAKHWQAAVWARCLVPASVDQGTTIDPRAVRAELADCIAPAFRDEPRSDIKEAIRKANPSFVFPSEAVDSYLWQMVLQGVLQYDGHDNFRLEDDTSYGLSQRTDQLDAQRDRYSQAMRRLRAVLEGVPVDERRDFTLDRWLARPIPQVGVRLSDILDGGMGWGAFQSALDEIERMLRGGKPAGVSMGLPIEGHIARAGERERLATEAAELTRVLAERSAAQGRSALITRLASEALGASKGQAWVVSVGNAEGATFLQLAADSADGLRRAETALAEAARLDQLEQQAGACRTELEARALKAFGAERAAIFLRSRDPRLGTSPWDRCTDPIGLRDCIALLPGKMPSSGSRSGYRRR